MHTHRLQDWRKSPAIQWTWKFPYTSQPLSPICMRISSSCATSVLRNGRKLKYLFIFSQKVWHYWFTHCNSKCATFTHPYWFIWAFPEKQLFPPTSHLYNGNSYTGKIGSLYWISAWILYGSIYMQDKYTPNIVLRYLSRYDHDH